MHILVYKDFSTISPDAGYTYIMTIFKFSLHCTFYMSLCDKGETSCTTNLQRCPYDNFSLTPLLVWTFNTNDQIEISSDSCGKQ